jgi:hypothetical protein
VVGFTDGSLSYRYQVVVPPDDTVVLGHFAFQLEPGEASARAVADRVVNGNEGEMFEDVTFFERVRLVNFPFGGGD